MFEKLKNFHFTVHVDSTAWAIAAVATLIVLVILLSIAGYYIARYFIINTVEKLIRTEKYPWIKSAHHHNVFHQLSLLVPVFIIYFSGALFKDISFSMVSMWGKPIQIMTECIVVVISVLAFSGFLNSIEDKYNYYKFAKQRPIKSYLQVIKILAYMIAGLIIASMLLEKSLAYFVTGLSAMTAVMLLVFKDSILGFVASVQLSAHDMIRLGDWIEVPSFGADGHVLDISLNTIKIQNFDNSIVMIPSSAFLSNSVKNWRAMSESGSRRIKRVIYIDIDSIKFSDEIQLNQIKSTLDLHPQTNLGLFRKYLEKYLRHRVDICKELTIVVHEGEALTTGKGLPLEIYAFTKHTDWNDYERTQAEIFEHVYASLHLFDLKAVGSG
jgi:miniconductance mechanosensitive channel